MSLSDRHLSVKAIDMARKLNKLAALPVALPAIPRGWLRLACAAALTLAVFGLELWLRVPVRPVLDQLLAPRRQGATRRGNRTGCRWLTPA